MSFFNQLEKTIDKNNSFLCIGLDVDLSKVPKEFLKKRDPVFQFNKEIISATCDFVCTYKPNIAFYESLGIYGLEALIRTIDFIHKKGIPVILDAKRGDVGHTSKAYAKAIFEVYKADATTINPYLGHDSIEPFISYRQKGIFILCLTSNIGFKDFQTYGEGDPLYIQVAKNIMEWNYYKNMGLVVGATNPEEIKEIRRVADDLYFLIPGVGSQKGNLELSIKYGLNSEQRGIVINSSRSIIYASQGKDFAEAARQAAKNLRDTINNYR